MDAPQPDCGDVRPRLSFTPKNNPMKILLILFLAFTFPALAGGKNERTVFFSADKIVKLDITVDEAGMQVLRETKHSWFERSPGQGANSLPEKPYVKGTVVEDGTVVHRNVGVRLRGGMGSWKKID